MQATAPAITCQTIQANLDHAFIVAPGATQNTAEVDERQDDARRDNDERPTKPNANALEGIVTAANGYRFTLDGEEWTWTKFRQPEDFVMPAVGDRVSFSLDRGGYVCRVTVLEAAERSAPGVQLAPVAGGGERESVILEGGLTTDDRGRAIARMNALTTATAILSSGGGATTADEVFALGRLIEAWIFRGEGN